MGEQHSLGLAGGAGRIDDQRSVVRIDRGVSLLQSLVELGPLLVDLRLEFESVISKGLADHQELLEKRHLVEQNLEIIGIVAVHELAQDNRDSRLGVAEHVSQFSEGKPGVEAVPYAADHSGGKVDVGILIAGGREHGHPVTALHAELQQELGHPLRALEELPEGHPSP